MTSDQFIALLRDAGYEPASYSGRAMYGKRCVSITVAPSEVLVVGAALAYAAAEAYLQRCAVDDDPMNELEAMRELMRGAREDNMGRDVVVYWPRLEWPKEEE